MYNVTGLSATTLKWFCNSAVWKYGSKQLSRIFENSENISNTLYLEPTLFYKSQ